MLAIIALAIPLVAEYATAHPDHVPGTGFSVLLYEPFEYAYVLLVTACFVVINVRQSAKHGRHFVVGALFGIGFSILWFVIAFLAVVQLHLSLGGKL